MAIKLLSENVYSQIAAGEVIDRPAAVVRELIDNSVDAGATEIVIQTFGSGLDKIVITDNGCGISKDDMLLIMNKHATSKIECVDDLLNIKSMGFRGEALYSIKTVSNISVKSNRDSTGKSCGYLINRENNYKPKGCACKKGTKIEVFGLFENIPARKKFLKSKQSEFYALKNIVIDKALSFLDISFIFYNDNKMIFKTKGDGSFYDTFFSIHKNELPFEIIKTEKEAAGKVKCTIYHSKHDVFFSSRKYQSLFTNKRAVNVPFFYGAVDKGAKNYVSPGRHILCFCYIDILPNLIDVNIHPAKKEIKFFDQSIIFTLIQSAVEESLNSIIKGKINNDSFEEKPLTYKDNNFSFDNNEFRRKNEFMLFEPDKTKQTYLDFLEKDKIKSNESIVYQNDDYRLVGTVFDTYILVEKNNRCFFIDQHALSEAYIFSRKKSEYNKNKTSQQLLIAQFFEVSGQIDNLDNKLNYLNREGFEIEPGEDNTFYLKAVPSILLNKKDIEIIIETVEAFLLSDNMEGENNDIINEILIRLSCREAVKKGDKLSVVELCEIVDLFFAENITNCPHGRPVFYEMSLNYIDSFFQRRK